MTDHAPQEHRFQAETASLLDMMIHHLYTRREVFLRELISNASDAIDRQRLLALTSAGAGAEADDYRIRLIPDAAAGTLVVEDNGIGMSEEEVVTHLGTIARSGTAAARQGAAAEGQDSTGLIGQFGVGFYSVFMVADEVQVLTRRIEDASGVEWRSSGGEGFQVRRMPDLPHGTRITLHLRRDTPPAAPAVDDAAEAPADERPAAEAFTDPELLRQIVKRHSDFIAFPILLVSPEGSAGVREEQINSTRPLWTRRPAEVSAEDYAEFYHHLAHDWSEPYAVIHQHVEGMREYTALLFIPGRRPVDLDAREHRRGLQLYARRVFIMDECRELMPEYLRFVRGLVDSPDLPLNVSRESIQEDRLLMAMRRQLTRRVLSELAERLGSDRAAYEHFWESFGAVLKEGFHYEPAQAPRLKEICLFRSSSQEGWSTLAEISSRRVEGQSALYYLTGERLDALRSAPQLEALRRRGVEVILLADGIDEIVIAQLGEVDGLPPRSVAQGQLDLEGLPEPPPTEGADSATAVQLEPLLAQLGQQLADRVSAVRVSTRLTDSAACLVDGEGAPSAQLLHILRAMGQEPPAPHRVLEVNAAHPLLQRMQLRAQVSPDDPVLAEYASLLHDLALLAEGTAPADGAGLATRLAAVMTRAMG